MKKIACIAFISVVLSGCVPEDGWSDSRLDIVVAQFEREYGSAVDYPVLVSDNLDGRLGLCSRRVDGKTVRIDSGLIERFEIFREDSAYDMAHLITPVVYHELAHCSFGLDHYDDTFASGLPKSFMCSKFHPTVDWEVFGYRYYKQELAERAGVEYHEND